MKMEIYLVLSVGAIIGLIVGGRYMGSKASDGDYTFLALWGAAALVAVIAGGVSLFHYL